LVGQVVFVGAWMVAPAWQGPGYVVRRDSISDLYAVDAPHGMVLVVLFTVCGLLTVGFLLRGLWPVLRISGRSSRLAIALFSGSIFALGDVLTPFERLPCRRADSGCSGAAQLATVGGRLDAIISLIGLVLFAAAWFLLASAVGRIPEWRQWRQRSRLVGVLTSMLVIAAAATSASGMGGLTERAVALVGATSLGALAIVVLRSAYRRPAAV
jgi:hypothetical protein